MIKLLKISTLTFGAALLLAVPVFAQSAPPTAPGPGPITQIPVVPVPGAKDQTKDKTGPYIEPTRGHEVVRDPASGRQQMVTPTGKHEKM